MHGRKSGLQDLFKTCGKIGSMAAATAAVDTVSPPTKKEGFFMPRKVRQLEDGGIYHIYARGNNRQEVFRGPEDFASYRQVMIEAKERYAFEIYHYCLMSNHLHLLIRVSQGQDLPQLIHWIQLAYARYYKKKYRYVGHLFQGRFRSPKIPCESYYLQCGRYIERNPVKAGLVKEAAAYRYSSARFYVDGASDELVTANLYYEGMGKSPLERREAYRQFVSLDEPYTEMVDAILARV